MTKQYVWVGVTIGLLSVGFGIGIVASPSIYTPDDDLMAQYDQVMRLMMQNPEHRQQMMDDLMKNQEFTQQMLSADPPQHASWEQLLVVAAAASCNRPQESALAVCNRFSAS